MVQAGDDKTCFMRFFVARSLIINTSIQIVCIMGIQGLKVAQGLP